MTRRCALLVVGIVLMSSVATADAKLSSGDLWVEFRYKGSEIWIVWADAIPIGAAPGNVSLTIRDAPVKLILGRDNASSVEATAKLDNGVFSLVNTYTCNDSLSYSISAVSEHHVVVELSRSDSPSSCSPAFGTSRDRYGMIYSATGADARRALIYYDSKIHPFEVSGNKLGLSLVWGFDHDFILRADGYFDCARSVKFNFGKPPVLKIDGKDEPVKLNGGTGEESHASCELKKLPAAADPHAGQPSPPSVKK